MDDFIAVSVCGLHALSSVGLKDKTTTKNTPQVMKLEGEVNLGEVMGKSGGEILTRLVKILISFFLKKKELI